MSSDFPSRFSLRLQYECIRYGIILHGPIPSDPTSKLYKSVQQRVKRQRSKMEKGEGHVLVDFDYDSFLAMKETDKFQASESAMLAETRRFLLSVKFNCVLLHILYPFSSFDEAMSLQDLKQSEDYKNVIKAIGNQKRKVRNGEITPLIAISINDFQRLSIEEQEQRLLEMQVQQDSLMCNSIRETVKLEVTKLQFECMRYAIPFPIIVCGTFSSTKQLRDSNQFRSLARAIQRKQKLEDKGEFEPLPNLSFDTFLALDGRKKQKYAHMVGFEGSMYRLKHQLCPRCHRCSLYIELSKKNGRCGQCCADVMSMEQHQLLVEHAMPIWTDDTGEHQFMLPHELQRLTIAEQLVIQKASPLIPILHIKNGTYGCKGHVCTFPQQINEICTTLPRLPSNVHVIKVICNHVTKGGMEVTKAYNIRKDKVLSALRWLKKYNKEYADITISEENLAWMGDENEKEIDDVCVVDHTEESSDFFCDDDDRGPAEQQVFYPEE